MKTFREILEGHPAIDARRKERKMETKKYSAQGNKVKGVWSDNMGIIWAKLPSGNMIQLDVIKGGGWGKEVKSFKQKGDTIIVKIGPRDLKGVTIT